MQHEDPRVYREFCEIAEQLEQLRIRARFMSQMPPAMLVKYGLLHHYLRVACNEARALAGDRPKELAPQ